MIEKVALEDPKVLAELEKLKLPEGTVVCADPWIYGEKIHNRSLTCTYNNNRI